MLRNPILSVFQGREGSGSAHELSPFMGWHEKNIFCKLITFIAIVITYANMSFKLVLYLRNSLYKVPQFYQMAGDSQNSLLNSSVGCTVCAEASVHRHKTEKSKRKFTFS